MTEFGKEVLTIKVEITGQETVTGTAGEACMIFFEGSCSCDLFNGVILPGGVDTQKQYHGEPRLLSARYILKGTDFAGQECKIFIENNGVMEAPDQPFTTTPEIITDSENLKFLESTPLTGTIAGWEKGVIIHIYDSSQKM